MTYGFFVLWFYGLMVLSLLSHTIFPYNQVRKCKKYYTLSPEKISDANTAINEPKIPVSETSET
jgi:hypothetical protein